jgi:hypothetical protein
MRSFRPFSFAAAGLFLSLSTALFLRSVSAQTTTLPNGIVLPHGFPQQRIPTQSYQVPTYLTDPPAVIPIQVGRQLFVDDFLIEQSTLTRVAHKPVMYAGNPVLAPNERDANNLAMPYSDGLWYDPTANLFKMWYDGGPGNAICYAYSTDGKNWIRPQLSDVAGGSNCVLTIGGGRDSATVWYDPLDPNPARRYKAFALYNVPSMNIYFSGDGIHWSEPQPNNLNSLSDRTTVFFNPFRNVWVESARMITQLPATSTVPARNSRARFYAESTDGINWSPADPSTVFWTGPDENDPPYVAQGALPELYNLDAVAYESVLVGLFSWYYPGPSEANNYADGPNLVELGVGFSRDGFQWVRPTRGSGKDAFIPAANNPDAWNAFNTQSVGGGFLVVGDELWFYFSGRSLKKPASGAGSTGLATLRRDGFYSMDADASGGVLTTRAVQFTGNHFFVNASVPNGSLAVEALDASGNVIPQFAKENCAAFTGDSTHTEITWPGADIGTLAGQPVKFRFYLTNGSLYSFWVTPSDAGASFGYVAAGGPGFTSPIDTGGAAAVPVTPPATPAPAGGTAQPSAIPSDAAAFWSFDAPDGASNAFADKSGNGADGVASNVTLVAGKTGQAAHFDGAGSSAVVASDSKLRLMNDLTISAWVRTTNASRYEAIVSTYEPTQSEYSYLVRITPSGTAGVLIGGANIGSGDRFAAADTKAINDGAWHHVAVVFRLGVGVSFYIDGALSSTAAASIQPASRGATLQLGITNWAPYGDYFTGDMDQVRMYARALSDAEIAALALE